MRTLLTCLLLAAAVLPAISQAQTVDICDRTPQVRDAIMQALEADDCAAVGLAGIYSLDLSGSELTALRAGDFAGLTSLQQLYLFHNQLAETSWRSCRKARSPAFPAWNLCSCTAMG